MEHLPEGLEETICVETEIWKKEIYKKVKIFSIPQKIFDENIYNFVIVAGDGGDCA